METIKTFKACKLEELTENETISSFTSWKENVEFHLAGCDSFARFLDPKFEWSPASVTNRGLTDDAQGADAKTAAQKSFLLTRMIGLIAGCCPETIRLEIRKKCTSLKWIFNRVRRHYGFN